MKRRIVSNEKYLPYHILERFGGVYWVVDCKVRGDVFHYTLKYMMSANEFTNFINTELGVA